MRKRKYITNLVVRNRVAESWKSRSISRKEEPSPSMDREWMEGTRFALHMIEPAVATCLISIIWQ